MEKEKKELIIKKGILRWGLQVGIFFALARTFLKPGGYFEFQGFNLKWFLLNLIIAVPIFCIGGYFWGLWMYGFLKKKSGR